MDPILALSIGMGLAGLSALFASLANLSTLQMVKGLQARVRLLENEQFHNGDGDRHPGLNRVDNGTGRPEFLHRPDPEPYVAKIDSEAFIQQLREAQTYRVDRSAPASEAFSLSRQRVSRLLLGLRQLGRRMTGE